MTLSRYFRKSSLALAAAFGLLVACDGNDYEGVTITFYPSLAGQISEPATGRTPASSTITMQLSRVLWEDSQVNIRIEGNGAGYGYSYVTEPAMLQPGVLTLTIPAGKNTASFDFTPINDGIFEPFNYDYTFHIDQTSNLIESVGQADFKMKVADSTDPFFALDFESCNATALGVTEVSPNVEGNGVMQYASWRCNSIGFDGSKGSFEANGYAGTTGTTNSYLMLPVVDGTKYSTVYLSMVIESYYTGPGSLTVKYSTNYSGTGNPEAEGVTWTDFKQINDQLPAIGSRKWVTVAGLLEEMQFEKLYIAFQYKGAQKSNASNWQIDNLELKGN